MTLKEVEEILPILKRDARGNTQLVCNLEHMKRWKELGLIPDYLIDAFFEGLEINRIRHEKMQNFKDKNPGSTASEMVISVFCIPQILTLEESEQVRHQAKVQIDLHNFMVSNWHTLAAVFSTQPSNKLFREVDHEKNFGISRIETDPLIRLPDLLDSMKALRIGENEFKARGEVKNSKGLNVILEFEFRATSQEDADVIITAYKKMMIKRGLQVFLAYWKTANEQGRACFECSISEVMNQCASKNRKSYFNNEERTEFWAITRSLASTKLKLEWPARKSPGRPRKRKDGNRISMVEWVEQPLIQIFGGGRELGEECPVRISVTLLSKESAERRFVPSIYTNETLRLHPSDTYFAVYIQSRATQRGNGTKKLSFDWDFAFRVANVEGTARANRRAAKAKVRKKLGTFRKEAIIEDWSESPATVHIIPQKTKEKKI